MPCSSFLECYLLSQLFQLSSFTLIKRLFSSSSLSAMRELSSAYLRLLIFLLAVLIPACTSSSLTFRLMYFAYKDVLRWLSGKESTCNAEDPRDVGLIPGSGRSSGAGNGSLLQYSCLENPMGRGAWRAAVHRVGQNKARVHTLYM